VYETCLLTAFALDEGRPAGGASSSARAYVVNMKKKSSTKNPKGTQKESANAKIKNMGV
tara:strand:- start:376 stop:552 length:177 start_codon:yes stop_codon:yes gene_type:complete